MSILYYWLFNSHNQPQLPGALAYLLKQLESYSRIIKKSEQYAYIFWKDYKDWMLEILNKNLICIQFD